MFTLVLGGPPHASNVENHCSRGLGKGPGEVVDEVLRELF